LVFHINNDANTCITVIICKYCVGIRLSGYVMANTIESSVLLNHRLNGSSSPVLTATCLSYGSLCDFLGFFPQPTWRSHPSTDFDAKWLKRRGFTYTCAFWSKKRNFLTPRPPIPPKFAQFWSGLRKFSLDFASNIGGLTSKHPLFFI